MRYRLLGLLLLITLSACQTTKVTPEKNHGAYYVDGRLSQEGSRNQFASDTEKIFKHRDLPNTTLLIYNHGTISSGIHQTCRTGWMPKYVRQLTYKDPSIVAYYFCSQESGGNSGDSIVNQVHYKRGIEIAELSDKFQELGIQKDNIFLMGHSGGASSSLMAASRTPEKFNSYIVTAPGYGYAYLGGAGQGVNYDALYDNWKTLIQRGKKSKGIVYGFPGDKYSPAKDLEIQSSNATFAGVTKLRGFLRFSENTASPLIAPFSSAIQVARRQPLLQLWIFQKHLTGLLFQLLDMALPISAKVEIQKSFPPTIKLGRPA